VYLIRDVLFSHAATCGGAGGAALVVRARTRDQDKPTPTGSFELVGRDILQISRSAVAVESVYLATGVFPRVDVCVEVCGCPVGSRKHGRGGWGHGTGISMQDGAGVSKIDARCYNAKPSKGSGCERSARL